MVVDFVNGAILTANQKTRVGIVHEVEMSSEFSNQLGDLSGTVIIRDGYIQRHFTIRGTLIHPDKAPPRADVLSQVRQLVCDG